MSLAPPPYIAQTDQGHESPLLSVAEALLMFPTPDIKLCLSGLDVCVHACNEPVSTVCACVFCSRRGEGEAGGGFGGVSECRRGLQARSVKSIPCRDLWPLLTSPESHEGESSKSKRPLEVNIRCKYIADLNLRPAVQDFIASTDVLMISPLEILIFGSSLYFPPFYIFH